MNLITSDWLELLLVLLLVALVAFCAASETSLLRVNRIRALKLDDERSTRSTQALLRIVEDPAPFINVILLVTLIATIGGTTLATAVAVRHFEAGEVIATGVMTVLLFVLAEVTPKTFAIQHTDRIAVRVAPVVVLLRRVIGPVATGLVKFANVIMPGKGLPQGPFVTEEELRAYAQVASEEATIEKEEKDLILSVFEFGDTIAREVMVPRPDIVAIEHDKTLRDVQAMVLEHGYSRIPVYREDLDDVVGFVFAKDVLKALHQGKKDMRLDEIVREAHFIPESKKAAQLLHEMQVGKFHIALVTDEYGSVSGLVTLEDLIEELVGEITDEYDTEEAQLQPLDNGSLLASGKASMDDVNEALGVELPDGDFDTVAGLMLDLLGRIPAEQEAVTFEGLRFTATEIQGRRIAKILIEHLPPEPEAGGDDQGQEVAADQAGEDQAASASSNGSGAEEAVDAQSDTSNQTR